MLFCNAQMLYSSLCSSVLLCFAPFSVASFFGSSLLLMSPHLLFPQEDFCKLMHLVSIDLSKNQLKELPSNFGALRKLQRLDLFSNNLTSLPLSLCYMKQLTWLDLKDNPLLEPLKSIAGDCIDDVQCKQCAKQVRPCRAMGLCLSRSILTGQGW